VVSAKRDVDTRSRRRRADGEQTRARVIDAAIESILEKGYYQTSSNEIARRAGVTWGTIQHQFGTREQLLLEVMNERWHTLQHAIATATIEGDTLEERLLGVLEVLASHYEEPAGLAHIQILLDLASDPNSSKATREAVELHGVELQRAFRPLFEQALGEAASERELVNYAFTTLRGYLQGNLIATRISGQATSRRQRRLVVRGVAAVIREEATAKDLSVD
jgi:AcrR family transcriptional regulator